MGDALPKLERRRGRSSLPPPHVKLDTERRRPATVGGGAGGASSVGFGPAGSSAPLRHPSFIPRFNAARSNANFLRHIQEQRRLKARQAEEQFAMVQAMRSRLKERVLRHSKKVTEARQAAVAEEMTLEAAKERAGGGRGSAMPPRGGGGGLWTATRQEARRAKAQDGPRAAWPGHGRGDWRASPHRNARTAMGRSRGGGDGLGVGSARAARERGWDPSGRAPGGPRPKTRDNGVLMGLDLGPRTPRSGFGGASRPRSVYASPRGAAGLGDLDYQEIVFRQRRKLDAATKIFCMASPTDGIRQALLKRGWVENEDEESPVFDLNVAITRKVGLLKTLRGLPWHSLHEDRTCDAFFPRSFDLSDPEDAEGFEREFLMTAALCILKRSLVEGPSGADLVTKEEVDLAARLWRSRLRQERHLVDYDDPAGPGRSLKVTEEMKRTVLASRAFAPRDPEPFAPVWDPPGGGDEDSAGEDAEGPEPERGTDADEEPVGAGPAHAGDTEEVQRAKALIARLDAKLGGGGASEARVEARVAAILADSDSSGDDEGPCTVSLSGGEAEETGAEAEAGLAAAWRGERRKCRDAEGPRGEGGGPAERLGAAAEGAAALDGLDWDCLPVADIVALEARLNAQSQIDGLQNVWIVKPQGKSRGRGIACFNRLENIKAYIQHDLKESWVVQKYVETPLLLNRKKFHIRQWCFVTDWNPLAVWFYSTCYFPHCVEDFSLVNLGVHAHLSNNPVSATSADYDAATGQVLSVEQFRAALREMVGTDKMWEAKILPQMKEIVVATLRCAREHVKPRRCSCQMYGFDFLVDTRFDTWLLEVNASPSMAVGKEGSGFTAAMVADVQEDMVKILVDAPAQQARRAAQGLGRLPNVGGFELLTAEEPYVPHPHALGLQLACIGRKTAAAAGTAKRRGPNKTAPGGPGTKKKRGHLEVGGAARRK